MCVRVVTCFVLALTLALALPLGGCSHLGLCSKDVLSSDESPDGRYSLEIVSSKCMGTTKSREVVMRKLSGWRDSRPVAVFDDSRPDVELRINAVWNGNDQVVIHAHGAKLWSFQPGWHDVRIIEK